MKNNATLSRAAAALTILAVFGCRDEPIDPAALTGPSLMPAAAKVGTSQVASMYALDFVATVATGYDMNDAGDVVGKHYIDTGCGPFCLPPEELAIWRNGTRTVLPLVPGNPVGYQFPFYLNNQGLIAGEVGLIGSSTHAAVWTPNGAGYTAQDLGVFPGATSADVYGLDDLGRMVGWSSKGGAIPTFAVPFMWTQAGAFVDLAAAGYPNEIPGGMSPGGKVITTSGHWYQLGIPGVVMTIPAPPQSFYGFGRALINDNGDQAHFLGTGTQGLIYPFRLSNGVWQQLSSVPTGHLSRAGLGSINLANDVSFTAGSTGFIAAGPNGVGQSIAALISPAYPGVTVGDAGPMNASGQILTQVMIGRSQRLMKMTPVAACGANCLIAGALGLTATFVQDPAFPGSCFQGGKMYNTATATVTVTDETGVPLANAMVNGRFMDDYWTDNPVSATTNASGIATWNYKGLCGVGAIAFFVDKLTLGARTFDRTRGVLANSVIPTVGPPPTNLPPVANFTVSCNNTTGVCSLDASSSTDDGGLGNLSFTWTSAARPTKTGTTITRTCATPTTGCTITETLKATDVGGLSSTKTMTYTVGGTPTNLPPIAVPVATCVAGRTCTFNATGSSDPDGTIVSYKWATTGGSTLSTQAIYTRSFPNTGQRSIVLSVTDNGGLTTSKTITFTVVP